jgi:hypothetical protein
MARRRNNPFSSAIKSTEVMAAIPQVVGHRLARMASAQFPMNARDRDEFLRMALEKPQAFAEAWQAMAAGMFDVQRAFMVSFFGGKPYSTRSQKAQLRLIERTLNPIHRKVTANARRLAKTKLR